MITDKVELIMFVESSFPPRPVSITAMSTFWFLKCWNAIAVISSKNVASRLLVSIFVLRFVIRRSSLLSEIGSELIWILSLKLWM